MVLETEHMQMHIYVTVPLCFHFMEYVWVKQHTEHLFSYCIFALKTII